jgi:hypothetical protein
MMIFHLNQMCHDLFLIDLFVRVEWQNEHHLDIQHYLLLNLIELICVVHNVELIESFHCCKVFDFYCIPLQLSHTFF